MTNDCGGGLRKMAIKIYPDYTMIFLVFNLLGWWYRGQPFFSWWWFVAVAGIEIIFSALTLAIAKIVMRNRD
jgi:hypothetical protein